MDKSGHDASHSRYRAHSPSEDLGHRKFSRRPPRPESPPTKRTKLDSTAKALAAELFSIHQILDKDEVQYVASKVKNELFLLVARFFFFIRALDYLFQLFTLSIDHCTGSCGSVMRSRLQRCPNWYCSVNVQSTQELDR